MTWLLVFWSIIWTISNAYSFLVVPKHVPKNYNFNDYLEITVYNGLMCFKNWIMDLMVIIWHICNNEQTKRDNEQKT